MKRRDFIHLGMIGTGVALIAPSFTSANEKAIIPKNIYYTKDEPGRWSTKVASHLPTIEITRNKQDITVKIITPHEMKGYEHYIVKHVLLDKEYNVIDEHLFDPIKENAPVSSYILKNYIGTLYALSFCNKHDLWLNKVDV